MKLRIENLGSISAAELEIAPLTVFVGPNNTNKTWTAYALYALASLLSTPRSPFFSRSIRIPEYAASVHLPDPLTVNIDAVSQRDFSFITGNLQSAATITSTMKRAELLAGVTFPFKLAIDEIALSQTLAIAPESLSGAQVSLEIADTDSKFAPTTLQITAQKTPDNAFLQLFSAYGFTDDTSSVQFVNRVAQTDLDKQLRSHLGFEARRLALSFFTNVIALPAERISLVALHGAINWLSSATQQGKYLSQPVLDFIWFIHQASRGTRLPPPVLSLQLDDILSLLQGKLLGGRTQFTGTEMPRTLEYVMPSQKPLRIHAASSLVKSLAGLATYLDIMADANDILIIDEPEMNAHPTGQLAIAELLAILVSRGIRVVITTHSPYIVDHLMNLIAAGHLSSEKQDSVLSKFALGRKEAFIKASDLAVYHFHDGKVESILDRESLSINWSTFADVSDTVGNIYSDILAARQE